MAEVVDRMPHELSGHGRVSRYDKWLDGRVWKLSDDDVLPTSMTNARVGLYHTAKRRGGKCLTAIDGRFLYVQFVASSSPAQADEGGDQ